MSDLKHTSAFPISETTLITFIKTDAIKNDNSHEGKDKNQNHDSHDERKSKTTSLSLKRACLGFGMIFLMPNKSTQDSTSQALM